MAKVCRRPWHAAYMLQAVSQSQCLPGTRLGLSFHPGASALGCSPCQNTCFVVVTWQGLSPPGSLPAATLLALSPSHYPRCTLRPLHSTPSYRAAGLVTRAPPWQSRGSCLSLALCASSTQSVLTKQKGTKEAAPPRL